MKKWLNWLQFCSLASKSKQWWYERLDWLQYRILLGLVVALLVWTSYQFARPANATERQMLAAYQTQNNYPRSRDLANYLLTHQQDCTRFAYFRFLRVLATEQRAIAIEPPVVQRTHRYQVPF